MSVIRIRSRRVLFGSAVAAIALGAAPIAHADTAGGMPSEIEPLGFGPDNVIHLIGDGMGFNQVDAASLYQYGTTNYQFQADPDTGEIEHLPGEASQVYENFPVQAAMATYQDGHTYDPDAAWSDFEWVLEDPPDSAATATALATGVRTYNGAIGVDPDGLPVRNLTERAQEVDRASGVVSSVAFSHATPGSYVAHNLHRNNYHDIAREMLTEHSINVIMGPGNPYFDEDGQERTTPEYTYLDEDTYHRVMDGDTSYETIEERDEFIDLAMSDNPPEHVFGLPQAHASLQYDRSGPDMDSEGNPVPGAEPYDAPLIESTPTLPEMTEAALNVLTNASDEGMFLMVEGGAIDWASHDNSLNRQIEEQIAFNETVETVVDWVESESSWSETLVVVTADHETGYLTGPGSDPAWEPLEGAEGELPEASWHTGGHTNGLVPIYARGAGASRILSYATHEDPVHGAYLENIHVADAVFDYWGRD